MVAGKVAAKQTRLSLLALEPADGVACRQSVVGKGESVCKAQTTNQLVPTSPATKKRSVDRPIRTEITECVTDWADITGVIRFLSILNTEA